MLSYETIFSSFSFPISLFSPSGKGILFYPLLE